MITMSEELKRLMSIFPESFVNRRMELILVPKENIYFLVEDVKTLKDLKRKVIEWVSRPASKDTSKKTQLMCLFAINEFLGTSFDKDEMMEIYTRCGNGCNKERTERFIDSGYNLSVLARQDAAQQ
jgi:phenylalanyl-tRNA synthetase beta subunit